MHIPAPQPKFIEDYTRHAYALDVSGFTRIPSQIGPKELEELRAGSERALIAAQVKLNAGEKLKYTGGSEYYHASRCMYCWGDSLVRLLDLEAIHAIASKLMRRYLLWDFSVLSALPTPETVKAATTSWHRDYAGMFIGTEEPAYLWFFICLDDATPENGATWAVPGSHRITSKYEPETKDTWINDDLEMFTSRIQLCAKAGDLLILNPSMLHSSGRNTTHNPRRLLNLGICQAGLHPLLNHWSIAGPKLQSKVSPRVRTMLGAERGSLDTTWTVLPDGWQTAAKA